MKKELYHLTIANLDPAAPELGTKGKVVSGPCLHYSAPSAGGWGIVRYQHRGSDKAPFPAYSWDCAAAFVTWILPRKIWSWVAIWTAFLLL